MIFFWNGLCDCIYKRGVFVLVKLYFNKYFNDLELHIGHYKDNLQKEKQAVIHCKTESDHAWNYQSIVN